MKHADEVVDPSRLLRAARSTGWMSYRGDRTTKTLVRCDHEGWLMGKADELPESSHRHPATWWQKRYEWLSEGGEPQKPEWDKQCGKGVSGLQSMRDELPEQKPDEEVKLHCHNIKNSGCCCMSLISAPMRI